MNNLIKKAFRKLLKEIQASFQPRLWIEQAKWKNPEQALLMIGRTMRNILKSLKKMLGIS